MRDLIFSNEQFTLYEESDKKGKSRIVYEVKTRCIKEDVLETLLITPQKENINSFNWLEMPEIKQVENDIVYISSLKSDKSLKAKLRNSGKMDPDLAIELVIDVSEKINLLNDAGLFNRIIKPENIISFEKGNRLIFSSINTASDIKYGKNQIPEIDFILNELKYTAPEFLLRDEQTFDISSSIYSLGIIFYELLTGITPFQSDEPDELVYSHHFREAVPPINLNHSIPRDVSEIVMKMIAKSREDRYITIPGLIYDLDYALKNIDKQKDGIGFIPGQHDIPEKLRLPSKLYGREEAVLTIQGSFEAARRGSKQVLFINGPSGIGKTALIKKTINPVAGDSVSFLFGKCEAIKRNIPYFPLVKAFNHIIDLILLESSEVQQIWKDSIKDTIGDNLRIIVDMIPRFKELLGDPPPIPVLESDENRNRINIVFSKLIRIFTPLKQLLIIFIDDAQWIDSASLSLMKYILSSEDVGSLIFLCSYRDNEITEYHNLKIFRDEIHGTITNELEIKLKPLDITDIISIISGTIRVNDQRVRELSELTLKFTDGNPLYIREFISNIYKNGILRYDREKGWIWDNSRILHIYESDSVIRTMINRMTEHRPVAIDILKNSSCIGNTFTIELLSEVVDVSPGFINEEIKPLIRDGYYRHRGDEYFFAHDKIIEGAQSLLTEKEICEIHYRIAQVLMRRERAGNNNLLFDIINHLTCALRMLNNEEKLTLAELNIKAGEMAKRSYAYEAALKYLYDAIELIEKEKIANDEEKNHYLLKIYTECFICEYMMDNMERSYELFSILNSMSMTRAERVRIYTINSMLLFNFSRSEMAIEMGIQGLKILDINISKNPGKGQIFKELVAFKTKMLNRNLESIIQMKKLDNDEILAAMELFFELWMPAYTHNHLLMKLLTLKMANITLDHGLCYISPFAFMTLGVIYGAGVGKFKYGYNLGILAFRLNEIVQDDKMECILNYHFASFQSSWIHHYSKSIPFFNKAMDIGLKNGLVYYTALSKVFYVGTRLIQGKALYEVDRLCTDYLKDLKMNNDNPWFAVKAISSIKKSIELMTNDNEFPESKYMQMKFIEELKGGEVKQPMHWFHLFRAKAHMQLENFDKALENIHAADLVVNWHFASPVIFEHLYIKTISTLNSPCKRNFFQRIKESLMLKKNMRFIKRCAKNSPDNFMHKYMLLRAEFCKSSFFRFRAVVFYNRAIDLALGNNYINDAAFAYDLASKFYKESGAEDLFKVSIQRAYECYKHWGAESILRKLEQEYPFIAKAQEKKEVLTENGKEDILTTILDNLVDLQKEEDVDLLLEEVSGLIYSNGIADSIIYLVPVKDKVMVNSEMYDGLFCLYDKPRSFIGKIPVEDIFKQKDKIFSKDIIFHICTHENGASGVASIALVPLEQRGKIHSALYLEKRKEEFSEDEKRAIRVVSTFGSVFLNSMPEIRKKSSDIKKDSNTFNNVIMSRLMYKINTDKVYLTEELTLPILANEIGVTSAQLSEFINNYFNMNFNSFINKYRIEEAKKIIIEDNDKTILQIAFEVGFNSLSVFYKAFLKFENVTPAAFRKLNEESELEA